MLSQANDLLVGQLNLDNHKELLLEPISDLVENNLLEIQLQSDASNDNFEGQIETSSFAIVKLDKYYVVDHLLKKNRAWMVDLSFSSKDQKYLHGLQIIDPIQLRDITYSISSSSQKFDKDKVAQFDIYTPINQCRSVNYENIFDDVFSGPISFYDIFDGRMNVQSDWDSEIVASKKLIVPIMLSDSGNLSAEDGSEKLVENTILDYYKGVNCELNLANNIALKKNQNAKFLFTNKKFRLNGIERSVKVLKKRSKSPFIEIGTEILVVDQAGNLPRFKIVYDTRLEYTKVVIYFWSNNSIEGKDKIVFQGLLSFDREMKNIIEYSREAVYEKFNLSCFEKKIESLCAAK